MDLVIALLNTRRYRTAAWIREHVAGYDAGESGDEAFARMFERDKQELRDLGIPIETEPGGDGYRIEPTAFALPPLSLTAAESAALAVAARFWDTTVLGEVGGSALRKVRDADETGAAGEEPGWAAAVQARLRTPEPAFADLFAAVRARKAVRFAYRGVADRTPAARSVEPWGLVNARGVWYLVGLDRDRGAERTFRLSRVVGPVTTVGRSGAVTVPPDIDLQRSVAAGSDDADSTAALLRVKAGRAAGLRRIATSIQRVGTGGYDDIHVPMVSLTDMARRVAAQGPDVIVVDPAELRDAVVTVLREAVSRP